MPPRFAKRVFLVAAIYGIVAVFPQYFMEAKLGIDFPPPLNHPEHFYGFLGVALAWQFAFLLIAKKGECCRAGAVRTGASGGAGSWRCGD